MTHGTTTMMPGAAFDGLPLRLSTRPGLISHQSNSLPSTPFQHSLPLSFESRSPSPPREVPTQSPRSARSESSTTLPPLRKSPTAGCSFETGMAYSRRRMQYSMGADKLEKEKVTPKQHLDPRDEQKLTGDMRELYHRLLPSAESERRRAKFVQKLHDLLNTQWPDSDIKVHVFGSSGNMLCTNDSDVDICITTPTKRLDNVCVLANALAEHGMERVVCVPHAKVPIVKIWDPELQLACDMNVNNTLALENTRMIKTYVEIDERVRPLAMTLKHWTKRRILNDAALGGTLSSYTWICLIINFLQTRSPPVLPSLHQRPHQRRVMADGSVSPFADDIDTLRGFGRSNKETLGELLFSFFRYYAHEIDYEQSVVSVRQGKLISKQEKGWHLLQNNRLCVEEPFNTTRNLGNTADDTSFRGIHLELRRAFTLIAEAKLIECCEQYHYPAEEERIWAKPPPQPRPVLSRGTSQSKKAVNGGTGSIRNGRHTNQQFRGPASGRRASSGASFGKYNPPQTGHMGIPNRDYLLQAQQAQHHLHDQLYQHYTMLQAQEQKLRMHLVQQAQAQAMAQTHDHGQRSANQQVGTDGHPGTRPNYPEHLAYTAPVRPGMFLYPLQYAAMSSAQQGPSTNPSSPSLTPAQLDTRRSLHRTSPIDGTAGGSLRSQSQPARSMPSPIGLHTIPNSDLNPGAPGNYYYIPQGPMHGFPPQANGNTHVMYDRGRPRPMNHSPPDDGVPKEYIGYYLENSQWLEFCRLNSASSPSRAYRDLVYEHKGLPTAVSRLKASSRSPSPPNSYHRPESEPFRYMPYPATFPYVTGNTPITEPSRVTHEPLIVDGSNGINGVKYPTTPVPIYHPTPMSETTSASEDNSYSTPATSSDTQSQDLIEPLVLDVQQQQRYHQQISELHTQAQTAKLSNDRLLNGVPSSRVAAPSPPVVSMAQPETLGTGRLRVSTVGSVNQNHAVASPTLAQPVHLHTPLQASSQLSNSVKTSENKPMEPRPNGISTAPPLLSPVSEAPPPPEVASRKSDVPRPGKVNGLSDKAKAKVVQEMQPSQGSVPVNGRKDEGQPLIRRSNGQQSSTQFKGISNGSAQANGWQQTAKKNNRKRAKSNTADRLAGAAKAQGEVLPAEESKRKGG